MTITEKIKKKKKVLLGLLISCIFLFLIGFVAVKVFGVREEIVLKIAIFVNIIIIGSMPAGIMILFSFYVARKIHWPISYGDPGWTGLKSFSIVIPSIITYLGIIGISFWLIFIRGCSWIDYLIKIS